MIDPKTESLVGTDRWQEEIENGARQMEEEARAIELNAELDLYERGE